LNRRVTDLAVSSLIEELLKKYEKLPEVQKYLQEVRKDIINHAESFRQPKEGEQVTRVIRCESRLSAKRA
jgi:hypothetical protein